jgi:diaminopimelate decarboxylase
MERVARLVGPSVATVSAGGGLPVPYRPGDERVDIGQYFQLWDATRKRLQAAFDHAITLEIEPGRYVVAESGYLVTEIRAKKQMGERQFYLVDAGFNNLARPILYGAYHPMAIAAGDGKRPLSERRAADVVIGGPLCESGDIFTQKDGGYVETRTLPEATIGDYLVIQNAGAYGYVMSSNYNSKPLAAEVLIENGNPRLVRKRQTFDDYIRAET